MRLVALLLVAFPLLANATAYTSTQNGSWSADATWGGGGHPVSGDTATIAHAIVVDVNSVVGTSPNNQTTIALAINGGKTLTVGTNVTLTVQGNISEVASGSALVLSPGSILMFDASASGGAPVYKFVDTGGAVYSITCNGVSTNHCSILSTNGFSWTGAGSYNPFSCAYTDFTRGTNTAMLLFGGTASFTHCNWNLCNEWLFQSGSASITFTLSDCVFTNSYTSASQGCVKFNFSGTKTSGSRTVTRNLFDKYVTYTSKDFDIQTNFFGGSITCTGSAAWFTQFRNNFLMDSNNVINAGNGAQMFSYAERNYCTVATTIGNPHYLQPYATGRDANLAQWIFEGDGLDLVDTGDSFLVGNNISGGFKATMKNSIVLPMSDATNSVTSGCLGTLFQSGSGVLTEWYRNTANADTSITSNGRLGVLDPAESTGGFVGQVAAWKSNLGWAKTSGQNYLVQRQSGTTTNIVTASAADYNWVYNLSTGNNQRGYDNRTATNALWIAGDAVAAGVDVHQGSGDPLFYDSARNLAKWCFVRGYGTQTYTNAVTVIQSDTSKIPDLINYVFEGFRPQNAACRNSAHDGGCVGAANFARFRRTESVASYRAELSAFGL